MADIQTKDNGQTIDITSKKPLCFEFDNDSDYKIRHIVVSEKNLAPDDDDDDDDDCTGFFEQIGDIISPAKHNADKDDNDENDNGMTVKQIANDIYWVIDKDGKRIAQIKKYDDGSYDIGNGPDLKDCNPQK